MKPSAKRGGAGESTAGRCPICVFIVGLLVFILTRWGTRDGAVGADFSVLDLGRRRRWGAVAAAVEMLAGGGAGGVLSGPLCCIPGSGCRSRGRAGGRGRGWRGCCALSLTRGCGTDGRGGAGVFWRAGAAFVAGVLGGALPDMVSGISSAMA